MEKLKRKFWRSDLVEKEEAKVEHKKKQIVVPGDLVTDQRKKLGQHVFIENGKVYSDALGITYPDSSVAYVVALHGRYMPQREDLIVGIVTRETVRGYMVDINSIYSSYIPADAVRDKLQKGSIVSAKVGNVNEINEAELFDLRVFYGGEIISVEPSKVPRIIGKNGSMLSALKNGTGCNLLVGRNGWAWVKDGDVKLLVEAIRLIESEAHLNNLTVKVEDAMQKKNPLVSADTKLSDALVEMTNYGFGAITVVNKDGSICGVFTDGDLRRQLSSSKGKNALSKKLDEFKYNPPVTVEHNVLLNVAVAIFKEAKVDTILVTKKGRPVGMLDIQDLDS